MIDQQKNKQNTTHVHKNRLFVSVLAIFVLIKIISLIVTPDIHKGFASDLTIDNILNAVNKERTLRNIGVLNPNSMLTIAGQSKADDMQNRHYFAHVDPDGNYIWDKIIAAGYSPYLQLGENLAIEFYDTESLISAWMNSPTHRANILQEGFRDQGMGINLGDTAYGQYHSAIANTFGTLATPVTKEPKVKTTPQPKKTTTPKTTTPPQKVLSEETPKQPEPVSPPPSTTTPITEPTTAIEVPPIQTRGQEYFAINQEKDFSLPNESPNTPATTTTSTPKIFPSSTAIVGNLNSTKNLDAEINRYLILVCGIALLLLMLSDIRTAVENKFGSLDKKINNLVVLLISILVIAFMYWL